MEPTCNYCKGYTLEIDDGLDLTIEDGDANELVTGHCPSCGTSYTWRNIYKYSNFEDLTEEKE